MKGPKDPTSGNMKREKRFGGWGGQKQRFNITIDNVQNLRGRKSKTKPEAHEPNAQSRTTGGSLLDDDQYEAFFAPTFKKFAKYIKDIGTLKNNHNRNGLLGSLEGLGEKTIDKNLIRSQYCENFFLTTIFHRTQRLSKNVGQC